MAEANEDVVKPTEPVIPVADSTAQPDTGTPQAAETAASDTAPAKKQAAERLFTQKEIDEQIDRRYKGLVKKAQREADRRVAEVLATNATPKPAAPAAVDAATRPDPTKFSTTEDYIEAVADWKASTKLQEFQQQQKQQAEQARATQEQNEAQRAHIEREDALKEKYDDYEDVVYNPTLQISNTMAETIRLSEQGPELAYYLGKHPAEASRIAKLPPILAVKELGKLEDKVATPASTPTRTPSQAPAPINPVRGNASLTASDEPRDSDPVDVWIAKRNAAAARARANGRT